MAEVAACTIELYLKNKIIQLGVAIE